MKMGSDWPLMAIWHKRTEPMVRQATAAIMSMICFASGPGTAVLPMGSNSGKPDGTGTQKAYWS